jgi:hypothetical protein
LALLSISTTFHTILLAQLCCCFQHRYLVVVEAPTHASQDFIGLTRTVHFYQWHRTFRKDVIQGDLSGGDIGIDLWLNEKYVLVPLQGKQAQ